ncbi:MAG: hypothetical protein LBF22_06075 [Deltaproteobacteria bacterium]|nr:hypothetical protein [Deltaproteobacteria bacterium]
MGSWFTRSKGDPKANLALPEVIGSGLFFKREAILSDKLTGLFKPDELFKDKATGAI